MYLRSNFLPLLLCCISLVACNDNGNQLDVKLAEIIAENDLVGDPVQGITIPSIDSKMAQLGKKLFYTKSLGGQGDTACVSCHHPMLGGGDKLALGIGVDPLVHEILGPGRQVDKDHDGIADHTPPLIPHNAPSVFNVSLWKETFFWDGRIQIINPDEVELGSIAMISTPDSGYGYADFNAGTQLAGAQSKFPITAVDEMLGDFYAVVSNADASDSENRDLQRNALASRLADSAVDGDTVSLDFNLWLDEFRDAFQSNEEASTLITQDTIALAIDTYERSMLFINNPWFAYLNGDMDALTAQQKAGAKLFYASRTDGGAGCAGCHSGYMLSDEQHHIIGFPQIGPGTGNGTADANGNYNDYGRENVTGDSNDRFKFRTPLLLNVEVTGPYTHSGSLDSLEDVIQFSNHPRPFVESYFNNQQWCDLEYIADVTNCESLYPNGMDYTLQAISQREILESTFGIPEAPKLNDVEVAQLVAFLHALTDPCVKDRECMQPWIFESGEEEPDSNILYGVDGSYTPL